VADDSDPPARDQRDAVMQRVRVGLTGLAAVFLLTLLAASILGMLGQDEHGVRLANGAMSNSAAADAPREPLAELGVAPGGNQPRIVNVPPPPAARRIVTIAPPPAPHLATPAPAPAPAHP
jgi:hypothetical protein